MLITWQTPLIEIVTPKDAIEFRKVIVANAMSCIGLSAGIQDTYAIFDKLLGPSYRKIPWDLKRPFRCWKENGKWRTQGVSTCGLVSEGIEARSGFDDPYLFEPYYPAQKYRSITRSIVWGTKVKAWYDARRQDDMWPRPESGSQIIIGCRSPYEAYGGTEHSFTITGWEDDDIVVSVDGGQVDYKHGCLQCVKVRRRRWIVRNKQVWLVDPDKRPDLATGRRLFGWLSPSLVPQRPKCIAPEGYEQIEIAA
jgi:hypothetical protein